MAQYKHTEFNDDDSSSIGAIQLTETGAGYHIRYHTSRASSSWRARNRLEKILLVSTGTMSIIIMILLIIVTEKSKETSTRILHVQPHENDPIDANLQKLGPPAALDDNLGPKLETSQFDNQQEEETKSAEIALDGPCLDKYCIFASSEILKSLDPSVDPCDDFYGYACNQWIRDNPLPDGKSVWGTFGKMEMKNQLIIKNVLEKSLDFFVSEAEKKAKMYYQSCLDEDELMDQLGSAPMQEFIRQVGGWNVTTPKYRPEKWSLDLAMKLLQNRYNMGGLFSWAIGEDDKNSSRYIIQIDQGGLALPTRDHYLNKTAHEKVLTAYLDYMVKTGVLLGARQEDVRPQMEEVLELETKIASITVPAEERRNEEAMYHLMTLAEIDKLAPFMNFTHHFADALATVKHTLTDQEKVVVYAPEFLRNLSVIISEYKSTEKGRIVLGNYLVWQAVRTMTGFLSKPFRDAYKGVRKALLGSDGTEETWRYCVADTTNALGFAVGAIFVRQTFEGDAKPRAEKMIEEIRTAFKNNLRNVNWMDSRTRRLAEEKADAITDMIGFPEYILNGDELDEKYVDLKIDPKEYFKNNIRINQYNLKKNLEKLSKPVNKTTWGMTPPTVNAYYTPTKNQIVFPAGILQNPFYDVHYPKSLNYGAMGVVMGHELTHAFDDQGREYDKYGNLNKWWDPKSIERFVEQTECIIKQYAQYEVVGRRLNGKQTVGENIADNGGLKAAFQAFVNSRNEKESDFLPLPGLKLTHRQLFFVSFAQVWCSAVTKEAATLQIEKDSHAPSKYRVIGPLSNLKEFAQEFNCPVGSRMNPKKKCQVW